MFSFDSSFAKIVSFIDVLILALSKTCYPLRIQWNWKNHHAHRNPQNVDFQIDAREEGTWKGL